MSETRRGELRLLTYNVRSLRDDVDAVAEVVRACRPDVVAVQEAPRSLRWRSKRAALARRCGLVVATADREGGLLLMTSLAVRVRSTSFALLPKTPELHQRAVCRADVELGGASWRIATVHFSMNDAERERHLPFLWAAREADSAPGPVVVAGDINEGPNRPTWRALAEKMQDAFAVAGVGNPDSFSTRNRRKKLDGVFVDRGVEVVECRVVSGDAADDGVSLATLQAASDHFPVLAILHQPPIAR